MVATLLKLRFLALGNSLKRSPWQLVAVILGGLYGLGMLALIVIGLIALSFAPQDIARTVIVLGGSTAVIGWIVIPLVLSGMDQTLDPAKLVNFPIPLNQLVLGLLMCGVLGIPGIITLIAALATAVTWWQYPVAAIVAIGCAVVGVLICVTGSRAISTLATGLASGRRFREISGVLILIPLILLGPILAGVVAAISSTGEAIHGFADVMAWTPVGAIWAVPSEISLGNYGQAALKFLIGLATVALFLLIWRRSLAAALVTPPRSASRKGTNGKMSFFNFFPGTPRGAVAARALIYWVRDPRYARSLIVIPLLPILLYFNASTSGSFALLNAVAPIVALLLALGIYADLSYDGTAYATHVSSSLRGVDDRAGRVIAAATFSVPIVIVLSVASVWMSDTWGLLPAILGISLGVLLTGFGISSVVSAKVIFPVPAPGDNPFKSPPGAGFTSALAMFAAWGILVVLVLPELILGIVAIVTGALWLGIIVLVLGCGLGALFLVLGVRMGGAELDRHSPELLVKLQRQA